MSKTKEKIPAFLQPAPEPTKQKPGPKPGVLRVTHECPYCGGTAHRKAVQKLKGEPKPYRRMYCADGCGAYHYRDVDTDEVVAVGRGPRVASFDRPTEPTITPTEPTITPAVTTAPYVPFDEQVARDLGIDPDALEFTAKSDNGRPRVIVNCLSEADIEGILIPEDRDNIRRLQRMLLTVQACLKTYRDRR